MFILTVYTAHLLWSPAENKMRSPDLGRRIEPTATALDADFTIGEADTRLFGGFARYRSFKDKPGEGGPWQISGCCRGTLGET